MWNRSPPRANQYLLTWIVLGRVIQHGSFFEHIVVVVVGGGGGGGGGGVGVGVVVLPLRAHSILARRTETSLVAITIHFALKAAHFTRHAHLCERRAVGALAGRTLRIAIALDLASRAA
eukprot:TRINITY_DN3652_c0_g1_i2.p5 TRINITY_DN3652_c0_g1~~TRINITY_DN3652_c0_g1_i2.p5  ORF type:complete len:119 (-),score=6.90 TRINITY_DN3652_c0_g1_i2:1297-1653(-)